MAMTRAEYEALAGAIADVEDVPTEMKERVALEIAHALCATNDRFDPLRFIQQTGLKITREDVAEYSRPLFLRTQTGVGATRDAIARGRA